MCLAVAHTCLGSSESVSRVKRSSVPWARSLDVAILWLSTISIVDCQGMAVRQAEGKHDRPGRQLRTRNRPALRALGRIPWQGPSIQSGRWTRMPRPAVMPAKRGAQDAGGLMILGEEGRADSVCEQERVTRVLFSDAKQRMKSLRLGAGGGVTCKAAGHCQVLVNRPKPTRFRTRGERLRRTKAPNCGTPFRLPNPDTSTWQGKKRSVMLPGD